MIRPLNTSLQILLVLYAWTGAGAEPLATVAHYGNVTLSLQNAPNTLSLRFEAAERDARFDVEWTRGGVRITAIRPFEVFPPQFPEKVRFYSIPSGLEGSSDRLTLKFRPEYWAVYLGNHRIADMPAPLPLPVRVTLKGAPLAEEGDESVRYQRTEAFFFADSFMRPEDPDDPQAALGEWMVVTGAWKLHTVAETALELGQIRTGNRRVLQPEFSPNFYSLAGWGEPAVLVTGYPFYDDYTFESALRLDPGEMGLLFYYDEHKGSCFGYTVLLEEGASDAQLVLWEGCATNLELRTPLAAAVVETRAGQWVHLRVKIQDDRIQCYFDQTLAFDKRLPLPLGGMFGLYVRSANPLRFDDIQVRSNRDREFENAAELRRFVRRQEGEWFGPSRWWRRATNLTDLFELTPPSSRASQWLVAGSPWQAIGVLEEEFELEQTDVSAGLIFGWKGDAVPYYRFLRRKEPKSELFRLERIGGGEAVVLEEFRATSPSGETPGRRFRLMVDATRSGEWRLYRDGVMVLVHHGAPDATGAYGPYAEEGARLRAGLPRHRTVREDLYQNRYEKNDRFANDPFMRHWASPEGQWLEERDKKIWYTGDFFGRFALRMPFVSAGEIHLGVPEGESDGEWIVAMQGQRIALLRSIAAGGRTSLAEASAEDLEQDGGLSWLTVQYDGHWLWIESGGRVVIRKSLLRPIRGRRIRVAGYSTEQLKLTTVERFQCKDFLFSESLYEWEIHGGRWEIINRFQCDPRWSHLNGESTNGPALLWAKYQLEGDFCVEMHAGQRHGWYERCGDLNLTVLNNGPTPAEGYTVTTTAWDPDQSQLYTILYRNGREIARSDQYLVPRRREGNRRMGYEPLVAPGRDVHGAWYYLKLRRIGDRLEFYFDNDLVFTVNDPDPIPRGGAGIWTFLNSMMVARVKLSAQAIRPKPAFIRPLDLQPSQSKAAPGPVPAALSLMAGSRPVTLTCETNWFAEDPVGGLTLEWGGSGEGGPYFAATARMGASSMQVRSALPPLPLERCAGWRFEIKRTPAALLDFHYSVGRTEPDGTYVPFRRFVYRLSGPGGIKGGPIETGYTPLGSVSSNEWTVVEKGWTPVTVWVPRHMLPMDSGFLIRAEGFGLMSPCTELQGVAGNRPGDGYAVRRFTEIPYGDPPELTAAAGVPEFAVFSIVDWKTGRLLAECQGMAGLRQEIASLGDPGYFALLIRRMIRGRPESCVPMAWIRLPPEPAVSFRWSSETPDAIEFVRDGEYPDPRFLTASVLFDDVAIRPETVHISTRRAPVPRLERFRKESVTVMMRGAGWEKREALAWSEASKRGPPVLLRLEGSVPYLQNFEAREPLERETDPAGLERARLIWQGTNFGRCLEVRNTASDKRLRAVLPAAFSLARHPLLQFYYSTQDPMTRISLSLGGGRFVRLSEPHPQAVPVRLAEPILSDGRWRSWLGIIADAAGIRPFSPRTFLVQDPEFGSFHPIDQTGVFSSWRLDELVVGPAVSAVRPLALTPHYFDFEEEIEVQAAVGVGAGSWLARPEEEREHMKWTSIPNGEPFNPSLEGLEDGVHHLFLRARNRMGLESPVTDIPFLLDRKPLRITSEIASTEGNVRNQAEWRIAFGHDGGAPLDPESLRIFCDEHEVVADGQSGRLTYQSDVTVLALTWPWLFRVPLNQTTNGQILRFSLRGIQDGAGNRSPDFVTEWRIDYEKDRIPPTLLALQMPSNVFWRTAWEMPTERNLFFAPRGPTALQIQRSTNDPPYLIARGAKDAGVVARFDATPWNLERFPFLALQLRRPLFSDQGEDETLSLTLELGTGQTLAIPLTARKGKSRAGFPEPPSWISNRWTTLAYNVRDLVRQHQPPTNEVGYLVRGMTLRAVQKDGESLFHLRDLYLYGAGMAQDGVRIQAYDASGMAPPVWHYEDREGKKIGGEQPMAALDGGLWVVASPTDKAGNSTLPIRFPWWGTHPPVKQEGD